MQIQSANECGVPELDVLVLSKVIGKLPIPLPSPYVHGRGICLSPSSGKTHDVQPETLCSRGLFTTLQRDDILPAVAYN